MLGELGGERIDCAGPEPSWTQPSLKATVPHHPHPGRDPATCPTSPSWLLPVPRWPPPSTCSQPGPLWLLCQASAASPEWAASDLLWFLFVSFGPESPRAPGRRPARCSSMASVHLPLAAAPHLSLLLSPRCQLGGNWHGRSPASFLQLGVATLLFFFLYFKHTHILTHAHAHTPSPPAPSTRIPSVRSSPSQESPEAGGGREPGCRAVKTPAPSSSLPLLEPSSYVRTSHSCRILEPPDWVHLVTSLVLTLTLAPATLAPCPAPSLSLTAAVPTSCSCPFSQVCLFMERPLQAIC